MKLPLDLNAVLDKGAPTPTGGLDTIGSICDTMGIQLTFDKPRADYIHW